MHTTFSTRRPVIGLGLALLASLGLLAASPAARAQAWPAKPITVIVGFAAGSATDTITRLYAQKLGELLNTQVLVDNKPGAAQLVAIRALRAAAPDGYTLYMGTGSSLAQGPGMRRDLPYDPLKDFTLISLTGTTPGIVIVNPSLPVKTLRELIEYARANPDKISYGSAGMGTANHLQTEYLMNLTSTRMVHIPYKSDGEVVRDVAEGRLHMSISTTQQVMPLLQAGRVRALAVTSNKPLAFVPGVPTLPESGVKGLEGIEPYTFYGLVGPVGMPSAIVNRLNAAVQEVARMPEVVERIHSTLFAEPMAGSAESFRRFMETEMAKWNELGAKVKIE